MAEFKYSDNFTVFGKYLIYLDLQIEYLNGVIYSSFTYTPNDSFKSLYPNTIL